MPCLGCVKMDYGVVEGIPAESDFEVIAEEALDFELALIAARKVQFIHPLTTKLIAPSVIICTGTPGEDISWFSVNFGTGIPGNVESSEVGMHFNVRMPQRYVVRNSRKREVWGSEETTSFRSFPFQVGQKFTIEALIDEKETIWAVDGEYYCSFKHRSPSPLNCHWIQITGIKDVAMHIEDRVRVFPTAAPIYPTVPFSTRLDRGTSDKEPEWKPNTIAKLPDGLKQFQQVVLVGKLRPMLHSFSVDLMNEAQEWPCPHILLHLQVRPYDQATHDRQLVVLNSWLGSWGQERRQRTARLVPGSTITLRIVLADDVWSVYADNMIIGEMELREDPSLIKALKLYGDFSPKQIYICPIDTEGRVFERRKSRYGKKHKLVITVPN